MELAITHTHTHTVLCWLILVSVLMILGSVLSSWRWCCYLSIKFNLQPLLCSHYFRLKVERAPRRFLIDLHEVLIVLQEKHAVTSHTLVLSVFTFLMAGRSFRSWMLRICLASVKLIPVILLALAACVPLRPASSAAWRAFIVSEQYVCVYMVCVYNSNHDTIKVYLDIPVSKPVWMLSPQLDLLRSLTGLNT